MEVETTNLKLIQKLFDEGIPVSVAKFRDAVDNINNVPETHFSEKSDNASRRVEMRLIANGSLICKQKNTKGDFGYFGAPESSIKFYHFK